jgi:hypothetical protein
MKVVWLDSNDKEVYSITGKLTLINGEYLIENWIEYDYFSPEQIIKTEDDVIYIRVKGA